MKWEALGRCRQRIFQRFRREADGQDLIEYSLLTGAISFAAMAMIGNVAASLRGQFGGINQQVNSIGSATAGSTAVHGGASSASSGDTSTAGARWQRAPREPSATPATVPAAPPEAKTAGIPVYEKAVAVETEAEKECLEADAECTPP